jgi:hypothetical protein
MRHRNSFRRPALRASVFACSLLGRSGPGESYKVRRDQVVNIVAAAVPGAP